MATLIFRCRRTGENVQAWIGDDVPADNGDIIYESLRCPICAHMHLVNRSTGRALGDDKCKVAN